MKITTYLILILSSISAACSVYGLDPIYKNKKNHAINGYDAVSYFEEGHATPGNVDYSYEWKGAIWLFSNEQHKALFVKSPETYSPAFGGYCAWAVGKGYTAKIDPQAWKIVDGQLYLNYSKKVQKKWEKRMAENIQNGNQHWPKLLESK